LLAFNPVPLADIFDPGTLAMLIPITGMMIGLIAVMQSHQRKMAEIIHGSRSKELVQQELDQMRAEISQLRSTVSTQALAIEGLASRKPLAGTNDTDSLAQRLG
jgi:hypothetical protein